VQTTAPPYIYSAPASSYSTRVAKFSTAKTRFTFQGAVPTPFRYLWYCPSTISTGFKSLLWVFLLTLLWTRRHSASSWASTTCMNGLDRWFKGGKYARYGHENFDTSTLVNNHDIWEDFAGVLEHKPALKVSITRPYEERDCWNEKIQKRFMKNMEVQLGIWDLREHKCARHGTIRVSSAWAVAEGRSGVHPDEMLRDIRTLFVEKPLCEEA
jgi:hypothetical protein